MSEQSTVVRVRPHGLCEVCGRTVQTLRDGTNRRHNPPGHHGWEADSCRGSGYRQARWLVGQRLWHHSGALWQVVEDRVASTRWRGYLIRCVSVDRCVSRYEYVGREMVTHGEYMHRNGWMAASEEPCS